MSIEKVVYYRAEDGSLFESEEEVRDHNNKSSLEREFDKCLLGLLYNGYVRSSFAGLELRRRLEVAGIKLSYLGEEE